MTESELVREISSLGLIEPAAAKAAPIDQMWSIGQHRRKRRATALAAGSVLSVGAVAALVGVGISAAGQSRVPLTKPFAQAAPPAGGPSMSGAPALCSQGAAAGVPSVGSWFCSGSSISSLAAGIEARLPAGFERDTLALRDTSSGDLTPADAGTLPVGAPAVIAAHQYVETLAVDYGLPAGRGELRLEAFQVTPGLTADDLNRLYSSYLADQDETVASTTQTPAGAQLSLYANDPSKAPAARPEPYRAAALLLRPNGSYVFVAVNSSAASDLTKLDLKTLVPALEQDLPS